MGSTPLRLKFQYIGDSPLGQYTDKDSPQTKIFLSCRPSGVTPRVSSRFQPSGDLKGLETISEMLIYALIALIVSGNLIYAYQCLFQTKKYIDKYGFGEGSAIMTRLVGTFAAGFAITLTIALITSIEGAWLLFVYGFVQACIGAGVCYQTIHSDWGLVAGVKTSAEGYVAPFIVAFLNLLVLVFGWDDLFKI